MCNALDNGRAQMLSPELSRSDVDAIIRLSRFFDRFGQLERSAVTASHPTPPPSADLSTYRALFEALRNHAQGQERQADDIDIWRVAGLKRNEVRTTAVLGWLLDHKQRHGYGSKVLNALLSQLKRRHNGKFPIAMTIDDPYSIALECYSFGDTQNRVDLMIDAKNAVIIIEVKIDAAERYNQIIDYLRVANIRAVNFRKSASCVIYLTKRRQAINIDDPRLVLCEWKDIAIAVRSVIKHDDPSAFNVKLLSQLAEHFRQL